MTWRTLWLVLLLSACGPIVPATTPPQLQNTPGAFIRLDEERVLTDYFSVQYPTGWRVVKINPAVEPTRLVFVSPDNEQIIEMSVAPLASQAMAGDQYVISEALTLNDRVRLFVRGSAPNIRAVELNRHLSRVLASLHPISTQ